MHNFRLDRLWTPDWGAEVMFRSGSGTKWHFSVHIDWERAINGWNNVYGFTRNSLLLLTFFCMLGALIPQYAPSQGERIDRIEKQQDDMQVRVDQQEIHGAVTDQKFQDITEKLKGIEEWQSAMTTRLDIFFVGLLGFIGKQMFERVFAGRFVSQREPPRSTP